MIAVNVKRGVTPKPVRIWLPTITMTAIVIKIKVPNPMDYEGASEKKPLGDMFMM
jgi:hypothetical protein